MKRIRSYNQFESFFGLFTKPDDDTANGILKALNKDDKLSVDADIDIPIISAQNPLYSQFTFDLDGFNIRLSFNRGFSGLTRDSYYLYIDDVLLDVSDRILKKIYKRINYIIDKPINDEEDYTRKDARVHFGKKK